MNLHRGKDLRRKHLTPKQIAKVDLAVKQDAANMEAQSTSTDRIPMNNKKIKSCLARIQKLIRETIRQAGGIHPRIEWDKKKRIWVGSAPPTGIADCCGKTKGEVSGKLTDALVSYVTTMIPPKLLNKGATHEVLRQSILSNLKDWEEERGREAHKSGRRLFEQNPGRDVSIDFELGLFAGDVERDGFLELGST